jgi:hypothetical protein
VGYVNDGPCVVSRRVDAGDVYTPRALFGSAGGRGSYPEALEGLESSPGLCGCLCRVWVIVTGCSPCVGR